MYRLIAIALLSLVTLPAFAAQNLTPEQKRELDRVSALRAPQEHMFADALAYHAELPMECRLPNSESYVTVTAGNLALKAIGRRGPIEWLRSESAGDLLAARIHSQNDGIIANLADQLVRILTLGLMDDDTIYTLRAGEFEITADFQYGTLDLKSMHCYVRQK